MYGFGGEFVGPSRFVGVCRTVVSREFVEPWPTESRTVGSREFVGPWSAGSLEDRGQQGVCRTVVSREFVGPWSAGSF